MVPLVKVNPFVMVNLWVKVNPFTDLDTISIEVVAIAINNILIVVVHRQDSVKLGIDIRDSVKLKVIRLRPILFQ